MQYSQQLLQLGNDRPPLHDLVLNVYTTLHFKAGVLYGNLGAQSIDEPKGGKTSA